MLVFDTATHQRTYTYVFRELQEDDDGVKCTQLSHERSLEGWAGLGRTGGHDWWYV